MFRGYAGCMKARPTPAVLEKTVGEPSRGTGESISYRPSGTCLLLRKGCSPGRCYLSGPVPSNRVRIEPRLILRDLFILMPSMRPSSNQR